MENVSINDNLLVWGGKVRDKKNEEMENWRIKNFFVWLKRKMRI